MHAWRVVSLCMQLTAITRASSPPSHTHNQHPPSQIAEARQCIYRNHLFLSCLLGMFQEGQEGDDAWAPPHLAPANAAADEHEDRVGAAVAPADHDKVRWAGCVGVGAGAGGGGQKRAATTLFHHACSTWLGPSHALGAVHALAGFDPYLACTTI